jgi:serine/threonine-protein kinase
MTAQLHPPTATPEHLNELLVGWQEARQQGRNVAAEELAAECPELVAELGCRIQALERMEALLGVSPGQAATPPTTDTDASVACPLADTVLPRLPGYEILEVLGQGGMGVVYKARQTALNRLVALKMILTGPHARPEQLSRFRAEAEAAAQLHHPNIVPIYEVGDYAGGPYFSMEYIEGGSLAQKLASSMLPARQAAQMVQSLAEAIQTAHQHGIVHRDLKPANVLLAADGTLRITDFGLAKRLESATGTTQSGAIMGTPSYIAPEQAEGKNRQVGPAVDVYALGAILYEALTGRPPFQGETTLDTLEQVRSQEPVAPSRLQPKVPRDLETICLTCLAKEPHKRYANAAGLAEDLRRFLAGEPILARPTFYWQKALKWGKRKPALAALLLVIGVGTASLLGVWVEFTRELQAERKHALEQEREAKEGWALAETRRIKAEQAEKVAREEQKRADGLLFLCVNTVDKHTQAAIQSKNASLAQGTTHALLYEFARFYAATAATYYGDTELTARDRNQLADRYAVRAVELLRRAMDTGYFEVPANRDKLKNDKELNPLRERPDFKDLLRRVAAQR